MATYAIGDIQGCCKTFKDLLKQFNFNPDVDRLLIVGDLVNRGPDSLGVLRLIKKLKKQVITVLGNHDLHLLSLYAGVITDCKNKKIQNILKAKDVDELISWLIKRPLIHIEDNYILVHAGILPNWTITEAMNHAQAVQKTLTSSKSINLLKIWQNTKANKWSNNLTGYKRMATILNIFTKMRFLKTIREMDFSFTGKPEKAPKNLTAWFDFNLEKNQNYIIIFGHWSALGIRSNYNFLSLDSGCVWGGHLTAIRLDDGQFFFQKNSE